ncbi:MAG: hypothetical protein ACO2O0_02240 [Desulfurococcales archaeon]
MPMLPRKPERAEALVSGDGKRIFISILRNSLYSSSSGLLADRGSSSRSQNR